MPPSPPARHLVFGASGAQGGAVARHLLAQGYDVRGFGRRTRPGAPHPHVSGDLADPVAVKAAFAGITHASVVLPLVYAPEQVALYIRNIVDAATDAGVARLVFNTASRLPALPTGVDVFETRRAAAAALLDSPVPTVVVRPPLYLENLCAPWVAEQAVTSGVLRYPLDAETRVPWLSHADLAAVTVAALTRDGIEGGTFDVGGPDTVTGHGLAAALGAELGREVVYEAQAPAAFEASLAPFLSEAAAAGVAATYHWAARDPDLYSADPQAPRATPHETLGVQLTPLRSWFAAQPWHALADAAGSSR